eukprot:SAG11_NODE_19365_length_468_cov_0.869919_2_plen_100_part_00
MLFAASTGEQDDPVSLLCHSRLLGAVPSPGDDRSDGGHDQCISCQACGTANGGSQGDLKLIIDLLDWHKYIDIEPLISVHSIKAQPPNAARKSERVDEI